LQILLITKSNGVAGPDGISYFGTLFDKSVIATYKVGFCGFSIGYMRGIARPYALPHQFLGPGSGGFFVDSDPCAQFFK
jgi:hypothetical protein